MIALIRNAIGAALGVDSDALPEGFVQAVMASPEVSILETWATYEELELLGYR